MATTINRRILFSEEKKLFFHTWVVASNLNLPVKNE
jgi:hypothetical protein